MLDEFSDKEASLCSDNGLKEMPEFKEKSRN